MSGKADKSREIVTPRWLQGINVGWTALEFGVLGFITAGWLFGWPLAPIAEVFLPATATNAPLILLTALLVFFYLGDMITLMVTYKVKRSMESAVLSKKGGPKKALYVHLAPGVYFLHRLVNGTVVLSIGLVHVLFLLVWDLVFLILAVPLQLLGTVGVKFGKATDKLDELRERVKVWANHLSALTAPF